MRARGTVPLNKRVSDVLASRKRGSWRKGVSQLGWSSGVHRSKEWQGDLIGRLNAGSLLLTAVLRGLFWWWCPWRYRHMFTCCNWLAISVTEEEAWAELSVTIRPPLRLVGIRCDGLGPKHFENFCYSGACHLGFVPMPTAYQIISVARIVLYFCCLSSLQLFFVRCIIRLSTFRLPSVLLIAVSLFFVSCSFWYFPVQPSFTFLLFPLASSAILHF